MSNKKPIQITINERIEVIPEAIFEGVVTEHGNGAKVGVPKHFIGKKVIVIVADKVRKVAK